MQGYPSIFKQSLICFVFAFWIVCANAKPAQAEVQYPDWVLNPDKQGFVGIVGAAPKQEIGGHAAQYRMALMKARRELAAEKRVRIISVTQSSTEDKNGKVTHSDETDTKLRSQVELSAGDMQMIEEWTHPETGELYVWFVIPVK